MKSAMHEALMLVSTDSICFIAADGRYAGVSEKKAQNCGLSRREMIGKRDSDFMNEKEAALAMEEHQLVMRTGESIEGKICPRTRNGEVYWYSVSRHPWIDDTGSFIVGSIVIARNITKRIEAEIEKDNLVAQILSMLQIVTHDLSSPLTLIEFDLKLIMRGNFGKITDKVRNALDSIRKSIVNQQKAVLEYLHKFNMLEDGKPPKKELCDVRTDIIDPVLIELQELIENNGSSIDSTFGLIPAGKVTVFTDKEWMRIVFRNLIMNALKHGGGCVISFGYIDMGTYYLFNVYNNGEPIPEDILPTLFNKFVQGESGKKNGIGLGLFVLKKQMQLLGGDMWCEPTKENHPNFLFSHPKP